MKMLTISFCTALLLVAGCDTKVPECDDKEVHGLLKKIFADNDVSLLSNSAISTIKTDGKTRMCRSMVNLKNNKTGEREKIMLQYEIVLADNKKEFTVEIFLDE